MERLFLEACVMAKASVNGDETNSKASARLRTRADRRGCSLSVLALLLLLGVSSKITSELFPGGVQREISSSETRFLLR